MPTSPETFCPCGNALPYADCCGRYHAGPSHLQAPTAQALMRSRYSAFVLGLNDYLLATWHPSTRPASLDADPPGLRWLGLTVKAEQQQDADHVHVHLRRLQVQERRVEPRQPLHRTASFDRARNAWSFAQP